jgi:hypothetical protein
MLGFAHAWPDSLPAAVLIIFPSKGAGKVGSFATLPFVGFFGVLSHQSKARCGFFLRELEPP